MLRQWSARSPRTAGARGGSPRIVPGLAPAQSAAAAPAARSRHPVPPGASAGCPQRYARLCVPGSARSRPAASWCPAVQETLGAAGLAGIVALQVLGAEQLPDRHSGDDQQEPAEHRGLAVCGAPAGDPLGERVPGVAGSGNAEECERLMLTSLRAGCSGWGVRTGMVQLRGAGLASITWPRRADRHGAEQDARNAHVGEGSGHQDVVEHHERREGDRGGEQRGGHTGEPQVDRAWPVRAVREVAAGNAVPGLPVGESLRDGPVPRRTVIPASRVSQTPRKSASSSRHVQGDELDAVAPDRASVL